MFVGTRRESGGGEPEREHSEEEIDVCGGGFGGLKFHDLKEDKLG